jgi:hypothetical protein
MHRVTTLPDCPFCCRHAGHSLASTIAKADGEGTFEILTGVGDSSSFHHDPFPTWEAPLSDADKCYFANFERPAADVAAQAAAALALVAHVLHAHSTDSENLDAVLADFTRKAVWAFEYGVDTYLEYGVNATCSSSPAASNCIGVCHEEVRTVCALTCVIAAELVCFGRVGWPPAGALSGTLCWIVCLGTLDMMTSGNDAQTIKPHARQVCTCDSATVPVQPCTLYHNPKSPRQHLFLAAAALFLLTGTRGFRMEADFYFDPHASLFHTNWNNVYPVGVAILAGLDKAAEQEEPQVTRQEYRQHLARSVQQWSTCSQDGAAPGLCRWAACLAVRKRCLLPLNGARPII